MSEIFLSGVSIKDFRTFGDFDISIPAGPGLTIVTGANGLGKSNFFDAIEWGLTGNARRFQQYAEKKKVSEDEYLTRAGAPSGAHKVKLTFTDQIDIERGLGLATSQEEIISYLARHGKKKIQDLATYLALTHFLGQASAQRFTSRDEKDQWRTLRGPSGIEQLESVRERIKHRSITLAFTRRNQDEQKAIDDIRNKLAQWENWQVRLSRLKQSLNAAGTLTSEQMEERIATLELEIAGALSEGPKEIQGASIAQRLAQLGSKIRTAISRLHERTDQLDGLSSLVDLFANAKLNADPEHPVLVRARNDVASANVVVRELSERVNAAVSNCDAQSTAMRDVEQHINMLESTRLDITKRDDVAAQIVSLDAQQVHFSEVVLQRRTVLVEAEAEVQKHHDAASTAAALRAEVDRASALAVSHSKLLELDDAVVRALAASASALEAANTAKPALESALKERGVLAEAIDKATVAYADSEAHTTAINAAVAMIASHIAHDDTDCPVCSTPFEVGQLKLLADKAARAESETLARISSEIASLRSKSAQLNSKIEELSGIVNRSSELDVSLKAGQDAASRARLELATELTLDVTADLSAAITSRQQRAVEGLSIAIAQLEALAGSAASASERRRALIEDIENQVARQSQLNAGLNQLRAEEKACSERIVARGMASWTIDAINDRLPEQRSTLEAARIQLGKLNDELLASRSALDNAGQILSVAERALAESDLARKSAQEQLAQLEQRWERAGLDGLPSRVALDGALSATQSETADLRNKQEGLDVLTTSNQLHLMQTELEEVIASMKAEGGEDAIINSELHKVKLESQLKAATEAAEATIEAQRAVNGYARTLKSNVEEYSAQVLAPLNGVISEFNEAMLSTPGQSIQFSTTHRVDTTTFGMSLRRRANLVAGHSTAGSTAPQLTLSEGQLAANGFSILCAASTSYKWSRWRALLLDDPLQHNDIIHTSAFIDVMRNLVELNGYQLIMSTHDKAEGEFIARKFDAAGLPCTRISLTGPSSKGVQFEKPIYNLPAQAIIGRADTLGVLEA
ncbi:AAA family ATPase [Duganella sp. FT50W]|uniref:AAA family ATPase n=1 Tax=Duganella lactea TaxID=2692173 RepID=A0A6L8MNB7_9BURK|nr:AAA family ATPase [Duganella lactea]MYM83356.1 AAA family ATPase [Duganella lactea]